MLLKIKKLNPLAQIPERKKTGDLCFDVYAVSEEEVAPNVWRYGLGFAVEMEKEDGDNPNYTYSLDLRPRSSIWKTGMSLANSEGTVDMGYRGEIMAVFYHVIPSMPRYKVGDRVCQCKIGFTVPTNIIEVDELSETERGATGFGSTGNR